MHQNPSAIDFEIGDDMRVNHFAEMLPIALLAFMLCYAHFLVLFFPLAINTFACIYIHIRPTESGYTLDLSHRFTGSSIGIVVRHL